MTGQNWLIQISKSLYKQQLNKTHKLICIDKSTNQNCTKFTILKANINTKAITAALYFLSGQVTHVQIHISNCFVSSFLYQTQQSVMYAKTQVHSFIFRILSQLMDYFQPLNHDTLHYAAPYIPLYSPRKIT